MSWSMRLFGSAIGLIADFLSHAPVASAKPCSVGYKLGFLAHHQTLEVEPAKGKVSPITIVLKNVETDGNKKYQVIRGYQGDKFIGEKRIPLEDAKDAYDKCGNLADFSFRPDWFDASATLKAAKNQAAGAPDSATGARSVDAADLDGDGVIDMVKTNFNPAGVAVRLGNADGSFRGNTVFQTGPGAEAVLLADFNGDGRLDLVVAHQGDSQQDAGGVSILIGNGDGTFGAATRYQAGVGPRSLAVADFNGDGTLDVATANSGSLGDPNLPADTSFRSGCCEAWHWQSFLCRASTTTAKTRPFGRRTRTRSRKR